MYRTRPSLGPAADASPPTARSLVASELEAQGAAALQWLDGLVESDRFYELLAGQPDAVARIRRILLHAPRLIGTFKASAPLSEALLNGELETGPEAKDRIRRLPVDLSLVKLADGYRTASAAVLAQWVLAPVPPSSPELGQRISSLVDAMLAHGLHRLYADFDVVAIGSYGAREPGPGSDADLLLLVGDPTKKSAAEAQARDLLALVGRLKRLGAPIELSPRLHLPEGNGPLVRTYDELRAYDFEGMGLGERFALGNARLVAGQPDALAVVRHCAYGLPLSPERLRDALRIKRRLETEQVKPQHVHRDVKLGYGGLNDIEWFVHLHELRYPGATGADRGELPTMAERIRRLARVGLINAVEADMILEARRYLLDLRARIFLQGLPKDLLPENPDRLDRLADALGLAGANELLARHRTVTESVRRLYLEGVERLRP